MGSAGLGRHSRAIGTGNALCPQPHQAWPMPNPPIKLPHRQAQVDAVELEVPVVDQDEAWAKQQLGQRGDGLPRRSGAVQGQGQEGGSREVDGQVRGEHRLTQRQLAPGGLDAARGPQGHGFGHPPLQHLSMHPTLCGIAGEWVCLVAGGVSPTMLSCDTCQGNPPGRQRGEGSPDPSMQGHSVWNSCTCVGLDNFPLGSKRGGGDNRYIPDATPNDLLIRLTIGSVEG